MRVLSNSFFDYSKKINIFILLLYPTVSAFSFLPFGQRGFGYLLYFILISTLALIIFRKLYKKQEFIITGFLIFSLYYLISSLSIHSLKNFSSNYLVFVGPLSFISYAVIFSENKKKNVLLFCIKLIVLFAAAQALIGLCQVTFGVPVFENQINEEEGEEGLYIHNRNYFALLGAAKETTLAHGTFNHFVDFGSYLVITIFPAYAMWAYTRKRIWQILYFCVLIGVIITFSRGALMAALSGIAIMYFAFTRYRLIKFVLMSMAFVLFFYVAAPALKTYVDQTGNAEGRFNTWVYSLNYAAKEPLRLFFGYGIKFTKHRILSSEVIDSIQNKNIFVDIHSTPVQMFIEMGVIGSTLFILAMLSLIRVAMRKGGIWSYCLIATIWGFLFADTFGHTFFKDNGYLFVATISLLYGYIKNREKDAPISIQENPKQTKELVYS